MSTFADLLGELWKVWVAMFESLMEFLPKILKFILWVLAALIILPCVYIAGNIYPMWVEWGEEF